MIMRPFRPNTMLFFLQYFLKNFLAEAYSFFLPLFYRENILLQFVQVLYPAICLKFQTLLLRLRNNKFIIFNLSFLIGPSFRPKGEILSMISFPPPASNKFRSGILRSAALKNKSCLSTVPPCEFFYFSGTE